MIYLLTVQSQAATAKIFVFGDHLRAWMESFGGSFKMTSLFGLFGGLFAGDLFIALFELELLLLLKFPNDIVTV